jgi:serine/threonine protein kinase/tetratricopeptide (TPR) repeat protein
MTAERWRRIEEMLAAALESDAANRGSFLDHACDGDPELRAEIASLVSAHDQPGPFDRLGVELMTPLVGAVRGTGLESVAGRRVAHYALERELGSGGMATVYLAEDRRHGRRVAVKVLRGALRAAVNVERFLQEIRVTARLTHPNILPLHDSGESDGVLYYVMPYVDGESLRQRLTRSPALSTEEAVRLAREVASALDYAHRRGVVHRDIKPENILLADGHAVVADFGIARAVGQAREILDCDATLPPAGALWTEPGVTLGTPAYMAPEQATGHTEVDHRADLYAWGVVTYELLAGAHPFAAKTTARELIVDHVLDAPLPLAEYAPAISPSLADLVLRCLSKDSADRPESAATLLVVLDDALVGMSRRAFVDGSKAPAVAVLPFANVSGDPDNEYLSDGITDEIIGSLGRLGSVRVAGRASCFALKGLNLGARDVGERLNVGAVVEGNVRQHGDRIRVSAELVSATDGFRLWGERYDRQVSDIFSVQAEIAQAIADSLSVTLAGGGAHAPLITRPTTSPDAYERYLKARYFFNTHSKDGLLKAVQYFEQAATRDPAFARAYAGLSDAHAALAIFGYAAPDEQFPKAERAARKAMAIDNSLGDARAALAHYLFVYGWNWNDAEREFKRAILLDPNYSWTRIVYAICLQDQGRFDEATTELAVARAVDPLVPHINSVLGRVYVNARRPDDAIRALHEALELAPHLDLAYQQLGHAYLQLDMPTEAIDALRRAADLNGPRDSAHLAYGYAVTGQRTEAMRILEQLLAQPDCQYLLPFHVAMVCTGLGNTDEAFQWLERGYAEHASFMDGVKVTPAFDLLHGDPRWARLLRRMNLEP